MNQQPLILLVDEDPSFQEIFSKKLSSEGFRVEIASNGQEGITKSKELKPDLILMDVNMPVMDGVETLMKIKEDPETRNIKAVFLTGFGSPDEEKRILDERFSKEIGAAGYVRKSDDLDKIVSSVKSFIQII